MNKILMNSFSYNNSKLRNVLSIKLQIFFMQWDKYKTIRTPCSLKLELEISFIGKIIAIFRMFFFLFGFKETLPGI